MTYKGVIGATFRIIPLTWDNCISMEGSHAHIGKSAESLSAVSFIFMLQVRRELCESLRFMNHC